MRPSTESLLERYGSPLFVYDGDEISERYRRLRAAMPNACQIHYAVKANPSLAILNLLVDEGAGLEIASEGELAAALAVGCPPDRILFAGPGKRDVDLQAAVDVGLSGVHCESEGELTRLDGIARRAGKRVRCGVRVHVDWSAGEERAIIGGSGATKFGVPESDARGAVKRWSALTNLEIIGLHVFNASNVRDAGALLAGAERTLALASDLADAGLPLQRVDVGGGLGIPYAQDESPLDVERYGAGLEDQLERTQLERGHRFTLAIEPGRWLVAEAGEYLATVIDLKRCQDVQFAVLDGGVHHMLRPALVGQVHPVRRIRESTRDEIPRSVRVVGPLCTSIDAFGDHELPPLRLGDQLAVGCAGAYGFTEAMPQFLSHAVPAEVLLRGEAAHLVRERREAVSHLAGQRIPGRIAGQLTPASS